MNVGLYPKELWTADMNDRTGSFTNCIITQRECKREMPTKAGDREKEADSDFFMSYLLK